MKPWEILAKAAVLIFMSLGNYWYPKGHHIFCICTGCCRNSEVLVHFGHLHVWQISIKCCVENIDIKG